MNNYLNGIQFSDLDDRILLHTQLPYKLAEQGMPLNPLPFPGSVYITDHSENLLNQVKILQQATGSNKSLQKLLRFYALRLYKTLTSKVLTRSIRDEFSLY
ncbi:MAG: hypothetical protein HC780_05225 [Leptolyngbyaceae cyanobacterium CSU_1_3]|nr:hypothetical protein [Leptolyngbyaceae cyanobacterium CSU_1_3]